MGAPEGIGHSGGGWSSRRHRSRVSPGQEDTFHTPPQNLQCGDNSQDKQNVGSPGYEGMVSGMWTVSRGRRPISGGGVSHRGAAGGSDTQWFQPYMS